MNPIRQLDRSLINKIAAGEVVERPLSVVKELTENAIDAGASVITVEIREGGLTQIRITDNGCGIPADEITLSFARHATSKISEADDLFALTTLGFRGEALSSIAAVSQVEMITKTAGAVTGTRVEVHGGAEVARQEIGCADGSTVIVSNLFYNTPARRKFIKKPVVEAGYVSDMMQRLALSNPQLTFRYINNGQLILQTNGNNDIKTVMHYIYGREVSAKLVEVRAENSVFSMRGFAGKPEIARGNRTFGHFFVNGRCVKSRLLQQAVETGMRTMLPGGRFPMYALYLEIPPDAVDVNVHPNKLDVRFADEEGVSRFVEDAVYDAFTEHNLIPEVTLGHRVPKAEIADLFEEISLAVEADNAPIYDKVLEESHAALPIKKSATAFDEADKTIKNVVPEPNLYAQPDDGRLIFNEEKITPPPVKPFFNNYQILGLLFKTYWLIAQGDSLYMVDQHAAHERVLFEELQEKAKSGSIHAQPLLEPVVLRLTPRETQTLRTHTKLFEDFGFDLADTPDGHMAIRAVPFIFKGPVSPAFFTEVLDKLEEAGHSGDSPLTYKFDRLAMAACKAAVKANDALSEPEAQGLIARMLSLANPFTCPHGRPTIIEITRHELERKFKRVT